MNDIFICPKHGEVADKNWGMEGGVPSYCAIYENDKMCGSGLKFISGSKDEKCSKCDRITSVPKNREEIMDEIHESLQG